MKYRARMEWQDVARDSTTGSDRQTDDSSTSTRAGQSLHGAVPSFLGTLRVMNASEVAVALDCDVDTVNRRAAMGDLPGIKIGRSWAYPVSALEDCLNEMARLEMRSRKTPATVAPQKRRVRRGGPPSLD